MIVVHAIGDHIIDLVRQSPAGLRPGRIGAIMA